MDYNPNKTNCDGCSLNDEKGACCHCIKNISRIYGIDQKYLKQQIIVSTPQNPINKIDIYDEYFKSKEKNND